MRSSRSCSPSGTSASFRHQSRHGCSGCCMDCFENSALSGIVLQLPRHPRLPIRQPLHRRTSEPHRASRVADQWADKMNGCASHAVCRFSCCFFAALCFSQTNTVPGEFIVDPPTLVSLGFAWKIAGDDNRNARVDVTYRKKGEQQWRKGLPLLRLQHEQVPRRSAARGRPALLQLRRAQHVCRQHSESGARHRIRMPFRSFRSRRSERQSGKDRDRAHPQGTSARRRRPRLSRLPIRLSRAPSRSRPSRDCWPRITWVPISPIIPTPSLRAFSPATSSWCMPASIKTTASLTAASIATRSRLRHALRRHLLSDPKRHARQTDRHQRRGRWRSGLRWRWLPESLQPAWPGITTTLKASRFAIPMSRSCSA